MYGAETSKNSLLANEPIGDEKSGVKRTVMTALGLVAALTVVGIAWGGVGHK